MLGHLVSNTHLPDSGSRPAARDASAVAESRAAYRRSNWFVRLIALLQRR
jgi:hypothetical protein